MIATAKGHRTTSHRYKAREAKDWTGANPVHRKSALNPDHADHILFVQECWQSGEMDLIEEYAAVLRADGYGQALVQSILSQGTQGMPKTRCGPSLSVGSEPIQTSFAKVA